MKTKAITFLTAIAMLACTAFAAANHTGQTTMTTPTNDISDNDVKVRLETSLGPVTILLYGDTPAHRDNFIRRVNAGDYDGVLFHRVISDFMVQTGDPDSKGAPKGKRLGAGDSGTPIDAEILFPRYYHHRGAIAAARQGDNVNPERRSSGSQFYIVTGRKFSPAELDKLDRQALMRHQQDVFNDLCRQNYDTIKALRLKRDRAGLDSLQEKLVAETKAITAADTTFYTPEMRDVYVTQGGTPHLDGTYTVFGKVLDGMDVIDRIEAAPTDANDRPLEDILITRAQVID